MTTRVRGARRGIVPYALCLLLVVLVAGAITLASPHAVSSPSPQDRNAQAASATRITRTTGSALATTTTTTLPPPAPGFLAGHVTAIGDSVMIDYQDPLEADIPGVDVDAAVSRQWSDGEAILQYLKDSDQLGAQVIVGLGTNGPISLTDFDDMMGILAGASRVVFVNVHVDRPWQDQNNAVIAQGATQYPDVYVADWASLAAQNPQWFGPDGTHLAIDGPGADALAALVASTLANGSSSSPGND